MNISRLSRYRLFLALIVLIFFWILLTLSNLTPNPGFAVNYAIDPHSVDIVFAGMGYTWVNGSDPDLYTQMNTRLEEDVVVESMASRFRDNNELLYSLRSVEKFCPWVRHVHIVTNGQVPSWLNTAHPRVTVVPHSTIFANQSHLPTFSSPAIEANLHHIPGLAPRWRTPLYLLEQQRKYSRIEFCIASIYPLFDDSLPRFIYLNDDVMFGNEVYLEDFYSQSSGYQLYQAWEVPSCAPGCQASYIGDGYCDTACNVTECNFDYPDCVNATASSGGGRNSWWNFGDSSTQCYRGCMDSYIGDKFCDRACGHAECGYDAFDCLDRNKLEEFNVPVIKLRPNTTDVVLPPVYVALLDTAHWVENGFEMTLADYDNSNLIRAAVHSEDNRALSLTFQPPSSGAQFSSFDLLFYNKDLAADSDGSDDFGTKLQKAMVRVSFNVTVASASSLGLSSNSSLDESSSIPSTSTEQTSSAPEEEESSSDSSDDGQPIFGSRQLLHALDSISDKVAPSHDEEAPMVMTAAFKRQLKDMYSASLKHVDRLYTAKFGRSTRTRRVPSHMPHFIDTAVMRELQALFPKEWDATSSHYFRDRYIIDCPLEGAESYFWNHYLDTDGDGVLNGNELQTLIAWIEDSRISSDNSLKIRNFIFGEKPDDTDCDDSAAVIETHPDLSGDSVDSDSEQSSSKKSASEAEAESEGATSDVPSGSIATNSSASSNSTDDTAAFLSQFSAALNGTESGTGAFSSRWSCGGRDGDFTWSRSSSHFDDVFESLIHNTTLPRSKLSSNPEIEELIFGMHKTTKYKSQIANTDEVGFNMVTDNLEHVRDVLNHLRTRRPKFICLNDNMNETNPNAEAFAEVQRFYQFMFPKASVFEKTPDIYVPLASGVSWLSIVLVVIGISSTVYGVLYFLSNYEFLPSILPS